MKVGILGTGDVGKAIGNGFIALGYEVMMGSRQAGNDKARAWVQATGGKGREGSFKDAAKFGEIIALCTLGTASEEIVRGLSGELKGKTLWDTTNPLDFSTGAPRLAIVGHDSLGERIQKAAPGANVVKVFNTVGNALMFKPKLAGGPPTPTPVPDPPCTVTGDKTARPAQVALVHRHRHGVLDAVAPGERGVVGLQLQPMQLDPGDPGGEAEAGRAGAAAEVEHARARIGGGEGGEEHRVDGGAIAAARLPEPQAAAEEGVAGRPGGVLRRGLGTGHGTRPSTALSARMARARKASRSATARRRGKRPMPPSSTLMWTSRTKQSISSARKSAVEKAMIVGSVERRISFMSGSLSTRRRPVERLAA